MTKDRREEFGLDPKGLLGRACPTCGEVVAVRTVQDSDGTRRYFCDECRAPLGEEEAEGFGAPEPNYPDA